MNPALLITAPFLACISVYYYVRVQKLKRLLQAEQTRADLISKKDFFEKVIETVADPIFVKNSDHQWVYGNLAFSRIINLDLKDYIGKSDYDIFPKEMADVFWAKDDETFAGLVTIENEEKIIIDSEERTIVTKKTPVHGMDKGPLLIGIIRDITERKRQEEIIANLYYLIESSGDLYCFCDLSGKPSFVNQHGAKLGFTNSQDHFRNFFVKGFDLRSMQAKLDESHTWEGEVMLMNLIKNEPVPYWLKIFNVLDENKKPKSISIVGTDIQERKAAEAKISQTSKMASLGEMAGGIAHEINNPLAIISGKAEQIKKYLLKEPVERQKALIAIEKVEETAFRISKIIKGLKSFSRTGQLDPMRSISIKEIIDETLDLCQERMNSEGITLIQQVDSSLMLTCRPTEIEQVLINLLNNSTDAIKGHKDPWIKISTFATASQIIVTVTDSGAGIPKEVLDKIMDPFFTTKEIGKGTGLGLSISKRIMESHNGLLVYNEGLANTSFSLIFNT